MNLVSAGRAFLLSGPRFNPNPHLWFVLTDPSRDGRVVAVMVVTSRAHTDKTIRLQPGDHDFIRHDSNIDFGGAVLVQVEKFQRAMQTGKCHLQPDMSPDLLRRVRQGLVDSPRTVHWLGEYCRARFQERL